MWILKFVESTRLLPTKQRYWWTYGKCNPDGGKDDSGFDSKLSTSRLGAWKRWPRTLKLRVWDDGEDESESRKGVILVCCVWPRLKIQGQLYHQDRSIPVLYSIFFYVKTFMTTLLWLWSSRCSPYPFYHIPTFQAVLWKSRHIDRLTPLGPPHWHFGCHRNPFKAMITVTESHWHRTDLSQSQWARQLKRKSSNLEVFRTRKM